MIIEALVGGVLAPASAAIVALLLFRRLWPASPVFARMAGVIALGGGFFAGYAALGFAPLWPSPNQAWHWLPYAALLAGAAAVIELAIRLPAIVAPVLRVGVALFAAWLLVPTWESIAPDRVRWTLTLGACAWLVWEAFHVAAQRMPALRQLFLTGLTCVAAAMVLERSGNAKFAQLTGVVAAAIGAFWLLELIRRIRTARQETSATAPSSPTFETSALQGAAPCLAILLPGLLLSGHWGSYSDVPLASYLLVPGALVAMGLKTLGPLNRLSPRAALFVQSVAVLITLGIALALAMSAETEWTG